MKEKEKKDAEKLNMSVSGSDKGPTPPVEPQEEKPLSGGPKHEPQQVDIRYSSHDSSSTGKHGKIDDEWVQKRMADFRKYKEGKEHLEADIIENEKWWKMRHWDLVDSREKEVQPTSAWLFNSLANKHADAMDNYPVPAVLPREEQDKEDAERLSDIIPCILEYSNFEQAYSDAWWYKLKQGTSVYGVFWDTDAVNGLGDIVVRNIDLLNIFWQPGIKDIQDSKYIFITKMEDNDELIEMYPELKDRLGSPYDGNIREYEHDDTIDRTGQSVVYDCYYKLKRDGRTILHYAKWCAGKLLYASENDTDKRYEMNYDPVTQNGLMLPTRSSIAEVGWYEHGMYPIVFDNLFPVEDSPVSFGYINIMKNDQMYIDKLNQIIMKNALMVGKPRWFKSKNCNVNVDQFADWSREFIDVEGMADEAHLRQVTINSVPGYVINHLEMKIDELKETSGNRDVSQGSASSGITSGTAIAALQEAGSKLSRDMIKTSYRAYTKINYMVLELIRQFYDEERCFRIDGKQGTSTTFITYSNSTIREQEKLNPMSGMMESRRPVFDIRISAQKQSPFNRTAQNETAKELFSLGFFNPAQAEIALSALNMMDFEGIESVKKNIQENSALMNVFQQLSETAMAMAGVIDAESMTADPMTGVGPAQAQIQQILSQISGDDIASGASEGSYTPRRTGPDGMPVTDNTLATQARLAAATRSTPVT